MYNLTEGQLDTTIEYVFRIGELYGINPNVQNKEELIAEAKSNVKCIFDSLTASQSSTWECAFGEIHQSDHQCTCE